MCMIDKDDKAVSIKRFEHAMAEMRRKISLLEERIKKLEGVKDEEVSMFICNCNGRISP